MKKFTIMSLIVLMLIAIIPFFALIKGNYKPIKDNAQNKTTADEISAPEFTKEELDYIACNIMIYIDESDHIETKKALTSLCKNNFLYEQDNELPHNELNIAKYSDDLLEELKMLITEDSTELTYKEKRVYIPIVKISEGFTATDDEYPYIESVASPWDAFFEDFDKDQNYPCGISVAGINYLSKKGFKYKDSLSWYLPNFSIETNKKAP